MGVFGCSIDGDMNDAKFSEPLPWIGVYIAAASFLCLLAMAADLVSGISCRKFWFPCKYFTLNSTSLTLIAVAIKLSVDLNTSMPGREDQLAKLSSAVLMCTIMANSMPSLGSMENKEILMNVMALGILVITLIVNICIELGTGVIYVFLKEHVSVVLLMMLLLAILSFSASTIPSTKSYLEMKYSLRHELASRECANEKASKAVVDRLKEGMVKYWMMAQTCSPQFVMGRSATCTASGAICLLSTAILAEAIFTSYLMQRSSKFCNGQSDYKWSVTLILIIQCVAVGVGTVAPAIRWFVAIKFRCPKLEKGDFKKEFTLENYWIRYLIEMKQCPLTIRIENQSCRKLAHGVKCKFLDACIILQTVIVFTSKVIRLISIFFVGGILSFCGCFKRLRNKLCFRDTISTNNSGTEAADVDPKLDLSRFVLHLEGEDDLVQLMVENNCYATNHWIRRGEKRKPKNLIYLLEGTILSRGFKGVANFDNHQIPYLDSREPQNCWALPVVTLTSIAIAIPNISHCLIKQLVSAVNEGLRYIRLVEDHLDTNGDFTNLKRAAEIVWIGVDLHHKWLNIDLHKISQHKEHPKEILQQLSDWAKKVYAAEKHTNQKLCLKLSPSNWPFKILAANCMYRITETILLKYEKKYCYTNEELFTETAAMISAIMGACLTNLEDVISTKCSNIRIEKREKSVREAAYILGKTGNILKLVEKTRPPTPGLQKIATIDEWRLAYKLEI